MRSKIIKFLVIINILFIGTQVPLTFLTQKTEPLPEVTFEKFRNGDYGRELEQYFKNNSYLSEVSSKTYKAFLDLFFKRSNKHVLIGKKNFLFLKDRTNELDEKKLEVDKIVNYLEGINSTLKEQGINFILLTIPNRSRVYPEYAYKTKTIPPVRAKFYDDIIQKIRAKGVPVINNYEHMMEYKKQDNAFFKVDHHWTWRYVHNYAPTLLKEIEDITGENLLNPKEMYSYTWEEKVNAHDKIARKLGYSKNFIPNKFKEVQWVPKFNIDKNDMMDDVDDNLMIISSSYARYGVVEHLSNLMGRYLPHYIGRGKGPTYGVTQLVFNHLIPKTDKPSTVLWLVAEVELRGFRNTVSIPDIVDVARIKSIDFSITNVRSAKVKENTLNHREGHMSFSLKTKKKYKNLIVKLRVKSKKHKSNLMANGKLYDIVHTGVDNYYKFKYDKSTDLINLAIITPYVKKLKEGRTFEILGVYTENE